MLIDTFFDLKVRDTQQLLNKFLLHIIEVLCSISAGTKHKLLGK